MLFLASLSVIQGSDYTIKIEWDELEGDAEGIIQYYNNTKVENIRGNSTKGSSDGNAKVIRTYSGDSQEFLISNSEGKVFNIWVINSLVDEDLADEADYYVLSESQASVTVEKIATGEKYVAQVPGNTRGLAFHAGSIIDGQYYDNSKIYANLRTYNVTVVNAENGKPLKGVSVKVIRKNTGEVIDNGRTDNKGTYENKFNYGSHQVQFSKDGFIGGGHYFAIDLTDLPVSMHFALTPEIQKFRIVLTWGANPYDLDAHLAGPKPTGGNFHIWYGNKTLISGKNFLDRDDMKSFGPETITIYKPAKGEYRYAVHNYSGRGRTGSRELSFSNARVDVYAKNKLQASFQVPTGKSGNVWEVFKIDKKQNVIPVEKIKGKTSSKAVFD